MGLYSVRLAQRSGSDGTAGWFIPAGYRAVVRSITAFSGSATASSAWVFLDGYVIFGVSIPAPNVTHGIETRQVAYEGESLNIQSIGPAVSVYVSGYLFADDGSGPRELVARDLPEQRPS